jgi:hypothetical protein
MILEWTTRRRDKTFQAIYNPEFEKTHNIKKWILYMQI